VPRLERPGGIELNVEQRGEGPILMLAPYWSGHPGVFGELLADLARDHTIVTFDARGTGGSTRSGPYDMATDCGDFEAVLDEVGGAAGVIAVANGCNTLVHVAARRPDLIGRALAFGAGPFARAQFTGTEGMLGSDSVVDAFHEMLQRDYRGALRTSLAAANPQMSEQELRDRVDLQISYCPQEAAVARVQAWDEDDPTAAAAALGDRLWIFSEPRAAGAWLPPLEERRRIIERTMPEAHIVTVAEDVGPMSRPGVIADALRGATAART
jgi:pimeloyl-ACP methyl ester carboxylesterase